MLVPFAHSDKRTEGGKPAGLDHADSLSGVRILKTRSQMPPPKIAPHRRSYGIVERPLTAAFREGGQDPVAVVRGTPPVSQSRPFVHIQDGGEATDIIRTRQHGSIPMPSIILKVLSKCTAIGSAIAVSADNIGFDLVADYRASVRFSKIQMVRKVCRFADVSAFLT